MSADLELLKAALVGRYTIDCELSRGGMATIYLAEDLRHRRKVAIKVLSREVAASMGAERFLREIEITANLTHPHILPLLDSGQANESLFYVMPYVEGESLKDRLARDGSLPLREALRIAREVADALSYAHGRGLVHRDIKPANILLESGHAVVADFGVARAVWDTTEWRPTTQSESASGGTTTGLRVTQTGVVLGSPTYMSPEQATDRQVDGRSDVYSLGCVLYEMMTGQPPFKGETLQVVMAQHALEPAPSVRTIRRDAPPAVTEAIQTALAKSPDDRYDRAADFAKALRAAALPLQTDPAVAKITRRRFGRFRAGARLRWVLAAVTVSVVAALGTWQLLDRSLSSGAGSGDEGAVSFSLPEISEDGGSVSECSLFGDNYNSSGQCFDEPAEPVSGTTVTLPEDFTEAPTFSGLAIHVDSTGIALTAITTKPSNNPRFDSLAIRFALDARYTPASKAGLPVTSWTEQIFRPRLTKATVASEDVTAAQDDREVMSTDQAENPELPLMLASDTLRMFVQESTDLGEQLADPAPDPTQLTWRTLDPDIVQVDGRGRLTSRRAGRATVQVATRGGQTRSLIVFVEEPEVRFSDTELVLEVGGTVVLQLVVEGSTRRLTGVSWSSTDESVATVSSAGAVTAVGEGRSEIVVGGPIPEKRIPVTVHSAVRFILVDPPDGTAVKVPVGGAVPFSALLAAADTTQVSGVPFEWIVQDSSVLSFDARTGWAKGLRPGTTNLSASSPDGSLTAGWPIEVVRAPIRIRSDLRVDVGETIRLSAGFIVDGSIIGEALDARWESRDPATATMDEGGLLTGLKWGSLPVAVSTANGNVDIGTVTVRPEGTYEYVGQLKSVLAKGYLVGVPERYFGVLVFRDVRGGSLIHSPLCGTATITYTAARYSTDFTIDCSVVSAQPGVQHRVRLNLRLHPEGVIAGMGHLVGHEDITGRVQLRKR
jgi:serine/threonine protein kinase